MFRQITRTQVSEVRDYPMETLLGVKGASKAAEVIREVTKKGNAKICCIGKQGTGKTMMLKSILYDLGCFEEKEAYDEAQIREDFKLALSRKCKYFTVAAADVNELLTILREHHKGSLPSMLVVTCALNKDGKKHVSSIDEITELDGETVINNIITIHKDKYIKVNELTI